MTADKEAFDLSRFQLFRMTGFNKIAIHALTRMGVKREPFDLSNYNSLSLYVHSPARGSTSPHPKSLSGVVSSAVSVWSPSARNVKAEGGNSRTLNTFVSS